VVVLTEGDGLQAGIVKACIEDVHAALGLDSYRRQFHQDEERLVLTQSGIGLRVLEGRENVRRSRERPDSA